jgi:hypothetical protein
MPELRCQSCLFWLPAERLAWKAGQWVCERCREQMDGIPRAGVGEVPPGVYEEETVDSEESAEVGLAAR